MEPKSGQPDAGMGRRSEWEGLGCVVEEREIG